MVNAGERGREPPDGAPQILEELRRTVADVGQQDPGKPRHRPDEVFPARGVCDARYGSAVSGADDARSGDAPLGDDGEYMLLRVEERMLLGRVRDLEDNRVPIVTDE